jgi:hypothetical protein
MLILARQYFTISTTFASSERNFSQASNILTKKRNKLSKDTFKMIILLKNWKILKDSEEELLEEKDQFNEYDWFDIILFYLIYFIILSFCQIEVFQTIITL